MKDIIQSLPRIKEHHIRDNYVPDNPDNYSSYIHDNMKNLYRKNQPIFLWDGHPIHTGAKPSIGAEHKFLKGYFRGQDGKTGKSHTVGQGRGKGTQFITQMERLMPKYKFNLDERSNKMYEPITLWDIQRLVDLGRLDPTKIIDITAIVNARLMQPSEFLWSPDIMGLRLVAEGANEFSAELNIEFQMADVEAIAAVEKNGGIFTAAFFDRAAIEAAVNPVDYFLKGEPIRKRQLPPNHLLTYYSSPQFRGYLADEDLVVYNRIKLAKEFGYEPIDVNQNEIMKQRKDLRQIWYGVEPGTIVNLEDKEVYRTKFTDESIRKHYIEN